MANPTRIDGTSAELSQRDLRDHRGCRHLRKIARELVGDSLGEGSLLVAAGVGGKRQHRNRHLRHFIRLSRPPRRSVPAVPGRPGDRHT